MKAHICIGGPLDGLHACTNDFWEDEWDGKNLTYTGRYADYQNDYVQFNNADRPYNPRKNPRACVAWIYRPLLLPSITLVERLKRESA